MDGMDWGDTMSLLARQPSPASCSLVHHAHLLMRSWRTCTSTRPPTRAASTSCPPAHARSSRWRSCPSTSPSSCCRCAGSTAHAHARACTWTQRHLHSRCCPCVAVAFAEARRGALRGPRAPRIRCCCCLHYTAHRSLVPPCPQTRP